MRIWLSDALKSSCSVVMVTSPVSLRRRRARFPRSVGAKVSGMVIVNSVTTPAKIMLTQMIHRQPMVSPMKPPTMGPSTGPPYGAAANSAIARPRSLLSHTSEMVPPARVRGAEAKKPQKKRQMRSVSMFCATAQGMLKIT